MSSTWNEIHQQLLHDSCSLRFQHSFDRLRRRYDHLSRFVDPAALLDVLHHGADTSDQKNAILRTLVEAAQSDNTTSDDALSLMLLALWPGLDAIRHRLLLRKGGPLDEIASDILARAVEAVRGLDPVRVNRIAATILMNVERDLGRDHVRDAKWQSLRVDIDVAEIVGGSPHPPIPRGLIERDLARVIGGDARLVLRVAVDGFTQVEVATELGLTEAAARKRYQRAIRRLRHAFSDPVSRSGTPAGFSSSGATAPSAETDDAGPMNGMDDHDDLARVPGLYRRFELSGVLETQRTYRLEEAGAHADGTPLVAIYTNATASQQTDVFADSDDSAEAAE